MPSSDAGAASSLQARTGEAGMINSHVSSHGSYHGRFLWYELTTTDTEAAKTFYAEVMGWGTQDASMPGMPYTLFTAGGASVSGLMGLPEDARNSQSSIDIEKIAARHFFIFLRT
jgi:hypothetical protein